MTVASAGLAAPAAAAPQVLLPVSGPVIYGFGTNQNGVLGNGTTTASPSQSPVAATGPPGKVRGGLLLDGQHKLIGESQRRLTALAEAAS
jgi:hypothetical protein